MAAAVDTPASTASGMLSARCQKRSTGRAYGQTVTALLPETGRVITISGFAEKHRQREADERARLDAKIFHTGVAAKGTYGMTHESVGRDYAAHPVKA